MASGFKRDREVSPLTAAAAQPQSNLRGSAAPDCFGPSRQAASKTQSAQERGELQIGLASPLSLAIRAGSDRHSSLLPWLESGLSLLQTGKKCNIMRNTSGAMPFAPTARSPSTVASVGGYRNQPIDALRGFACIAVVAQHYYLMYPEQLRGGRELSEIWFWLRHSPFTLIFGGHNRSILFFVLSAFMMTLSWKKTDGLCYSCFITRRTLRLYTPFFVSLVIAFFLEICQPCVGGPNLSRWYNTDVCRTYVDGSIYGHFFLTGLRDHLSLNVTLWTLVHEIRILLIMPLVIFLCERRPICCLFVGYFIFNCAAWWLGSGPWNLSFFDSCISTAHYLIFFVIGAVGALKLQILIDFGRGLPKCALGFLFCLAFSALMCNYSADAYSEMFVTEIIWGSGSIMLIIMCLAVRIDKSLTNFYSLNWVGRRAYSIFLLHLLIIKQITTLAGQTIGILSCQAIAFGLILIAADLLYRFVEKPIGVLFLPAMTAESARS